MLSTWRAWPPIRAYITEDTVTMECATALDSAAFCVAPAFGLSSRSARERPESAAALHREGRLEAPPLSGSDDLAWVGRVQSGDEEAARDLVRRLYPTVMRSIRCHLPRYGTEEDLAQTVFAKVFAKLHQFSGLVPLEHWVARITINTCLSQLSREKARPELRMSDLSEEDQTVVEHLFRTDEDLPPHRCTEVRELVDKMLGELKPEERLVITLLHLEERSTEEISCVTGWSVSLVKVRAFRARAKMRRILAKLMKQRQGHDRGA